MHNVNRLWSLCLGVGLFSLTAYAADAPQPPSTAVPALRFGYDVPGQIHDDPSLFVRAIIRSERTDLPPRNGSPESVLTYHVCNIEPGDSSTGRASARLYFQWPDAGFRVAVQREVPFERCVKFIRRITGEAKQATSDILYTYRATAIPAQDIWTMSWTPPWTKPSKYWDHSVAILEDLFKGMKNPQEVYRIEVTRKEPSDKGAYQLLLWQPGTQLYLALPKLTAEQIRQYRASLGTYESSGLLFSIRPAQELAGEFGQDPWVLQSFEGRDVLKLERSPSREKDGQLNSIQVVIPADVTELVRLSSVLRERTAGRALYQAQYITAGN